MGCEKFLTPERLQKLLQIARESSSETSICIRENIGIRYKSGEVSSVERAGCYPECSCIVHIHPDKSTNNELFFCSMPSSVDIAIIIADAVELVRKNVSPSEFEDMVVFPSGYVIYKVGSVSKMIQWIEKNNLHSYDDIESSLKSVLSSIVASCMNMHNVFHVSEIKNRDEFVDDVRKIWYEFLESIGISIEHVNVEKFLK